MIKSSNEDKLPNGNLATVEISKLTNYCLNPEHPMGGPKARVFRSFLGITTEHAEFLRDALLEAARTGIAEPRTEDVYGKRYEIRFSMTGPNGNSAEVTSAWIIDAGQETPRLTSTYIKL